MTQAARTRRKRGEHWAPLAAPDQTAGTAHTPVSPVKSAASTNSVHELKEEDQTLRTTTVTGLLKNFQAPHSLYGSHKQ